MDDAEAVKDFRAAVVDLATPRGHGWCGGLREKAETHVAHVLPAVAELLGMSEAELARMARAVNASKTKGE